MYWPPVPPALDSLMPPVSGLLQPTEIRPEEPAVVAQSVPGAKTSLFSGPRGWQVGGTSLQMTAVVRARPASPAYSPRRSSLILGPPSASTLMRKILSMATSAV